MVKRGLQACFTILVLPPLLFKLLAILIVVFLFVDVTARFVLAMLKPGSFLTRDFAVGLRLRFHFVSPGLLLFHPHGFSLGQRAVIYTMLDTFLLSLLATINTRRLLREPGEAESEHKCNR